MAALEPEQARTALRSALAARSRGRIGTPLQQLYLKDQPRPRPALAKTFWGAPFEVVLPELVSCEIHRYGLIEPELTALFVEIVRPGTVVFDVGAHLGYYSSLASALGAKVHAFEPCPDTASLLEKNVPASVTIVRLGLWSEDTTLELKDFGSSHSAINTFLQPKDELADEPLRLAQVDLTTLDRYVEENGELPDLIKIDVEGAEPQVLDGASTTIRSAQPLITIEVGDTDASRTSRVAVDRAMGLRYDPYELSHRSIRPHEPQGDYGYGNLLLAPRGSDRISRIGGAVATSLRGPIPGA